MFKFPDVQSLGAIIFDFDGVFTDNYVYTDANGTESVRTSRADSYGLSVLSQYIIEHQVDLELFILSTETNPVVAQRAAKLGLRVEQGASDKRAFLEHYFANRESPVTWANTLYLGNDLNDLEVMSRVGYSACPSDAHPLIRSIASYVSKKPGGSGFIRETIELLLEAKY